MVFTTTFAKTSNIEAANKKLISQVINYLSERAGETPDLESDVLYTGLKNLYPHLLIDYVSISEDISGNTVYTFSFKIISYAGISSKEAQLELKDILIIKDLNKYFSSWNDQNENGGIFKIIPIDGTETLIVTYTI